MSPDEGSRYVVGIDLGTTNCAVCFVDTLQADWRVENFRIPQWVDLGQWEARETLPSFHYELAASESAGGVASLPWHGGKDSATSCVGVVCS